MKTVKTRGVNLCSKRTYSAASEHCYSGETRPFSSLSDLGERLNQKRFKTYEPRNEELPTWNAEELGKYYDIERMVVKINEDKFKAAGDVIKPREYRTVRRVPDDAGKFKWIQIELEEIGREYGLDDDQVLVMFESVNCDKKRLRAKLEGKNFCTWKKLEDLTLKSYYE